MFTVRAPNEIDEEKAILVAEYMRVHGPPRIRIVLAQIGSGYFYAVEGSHRLFVAKIMGITPIFEIMTSEFKTEHGYGADLATDTTTTPYRFLLHVHGWGGGGMEYEYPDSALPLPKTGL